MKSWIAWGVAVRSGLLPSFRQFQTLSFSITTRACGAKIAFRRKERLSPPVYFLMTELCIRCGKPTIYNSDTPVSDRLYYINGSGQLCQECFSTLYGAPSNNPISSTAGDKDKTGNKHAGAEELDSALDPKERLKMARKLHPLRRSDFTAAELEKLKALAPEEYELLS